MKRENDLKKKFSYSKFIKRVAWLLTSKDKKQLILILLLMMAGAVLEFLGIGLIPIFINAFIGANELFTFPIIDIKVKQKSAFSILSGLVVSVFIVKCIFFSIFYKIQSRFVTSIRRRLASRLFSTYLKKVPWTFYHERHTSEMYRNIMRETTELMLGALMPMLSVMLGFFVLLPIIIFTIFMLPIECTLAYICFGLITVIFFNNHKKVLSHSGNTAQLEHKLTTKKINEGLYTFSEARVLDKTDYLFKRFHNSLSNYLTADRVRIIKSLVFPHYLEALALIGLMMVLCIFYIKDQSFTSILPQIGLLSLVTVRLRQNATKIFISLGQIQFSKYAVDHIFNDLKEFDKPSSSDEKTVNDKSIKLVGQLNIQNVSYTYSGYEKPVLSNINISIGSSESVAFVGSTGSGKSTLMNLILGFLKPSSGNISVDNKDINKNLEAWWKNVGYVPQGIHLIDDTIISNIAFGIPEKEINYESIKDAIKIAQLEEVIDELKDGLQTIVGEAGNKLSGGQKQRVVIARALYNNPKLLLMDEATSALDSNTEANLYRDLKKYRPEISSITITHRLQTIKNCDQIFFLDDGEISESGTHDHLMRTVPAYQELQNK